METKLLYGDLLILLIAAVNHLKYNNIKYNGVFRNFNHETTVVQFASRIDFFKQLGIDIPEKLTRKDSRGKFTEITHYHDTDSAYNLHKEFILILKNQSTINQNTLNMLDFCIYEILDNVLTHAQSPTNGMGIAQLFENKQEIRIMICDTGIGIHSALTNTEKSNFKSLNQQ